MRFCRQAGFVCRETAVNHRGIFPPPQLPHNPNCLCVVVEKVISSAQFQNSSLKMIIPINVAIFRSYSLTKVFFFFFGVCFVVVEEHEC